MSTELIITASSIITIDPALPRATAVAVSGERIVAVGDLEQCRAALPNAVVQDLGDIVLMPGFIESHSHPVLSGIMTQPPVHWIAPYVDSPTWDDCVALFRRLDADEPADQMLLFNGFDGLLHGAPAPTAATLDEFFPSRPVLVIDNSGHGAYVNTAMLEALGWIEDPPADPVGGSFARRADGSLDGQIWELPAIMMAANMPMAKVISSPLASAGQWYALMARSGITSTSEMTYNRGLAASFIALAQQPSSPLRISLYHMSTEADCGDPFTSAVPESMLQKKGIKLWADGSPWVGNVALTFPYLDTETTRRAHIAPGPRGLDQMNYSREQIEAVIDAHVDAGWQFSFHVNGDAALDVVLDAFESALTRHGLLGTDHRWRLEHLGAARADQFERAASLGVVASLGAFQFTYWGDLLDGQMFDHEHGAQWCRVKDATDAGTVPSYHNDGSVSPPIPLRNIQTCVTRTTISGTVHGPEQIVSLDEALKAQTINAAFALGREHEIGSISVGKFADFVELSADPYVVDPLKLTTDITVLGTWLGGARIDLDEFLVAVGAEEPAAHAHLATPHRKCC